MNLLAPRLGEASGWAACEPLPHCLQGRLHLPYIARMHAGVTLTEIYRQQADGCRQGGWRWSNERQLLVAGAETDAAVSVDGVTICGWAVRQNCVS